MSKRLGSRIIAVVTCVVRVALTIVIVVIIVVILIIAIAGRGLLEEMIKGGLRSRVVESAAIPELASFVPVLAE